jgi:hypothetical protein
MVLRVQKVHKVSRGLQEIKDHRGWKVQKVQQEQMVLKV